MLSYCFVVFPWKNGPPLKDSQRLSSEANEMQINFSFFVGMGILPKVVHCCVLKEAECKSPHIAIWGICSSRFQLLLELFVPDND